MKAVSVKTLCDRCQTKLKQKLMIVKHEKKEFFKNPILLEIKNLEIIKKRKEYNVNILIYLQCAKRRFGLFVKESLFDEKDDIKAIVKGCLFDSNEENEIQTNFPKEHSIVKKEVNLPVSVKQHSVAVLKKGYLQNRHLAVTPYHRLCCVTQMKRHILIIGLLVILLIAAGLGTTLGLYFSQTGSNPSTVASPKKWSRVSLDTVVKNSMLGNIKNNTNTTILAAVKAKNPDLKTEDVFIQDILETKARVYVKSSSIYYVDNSYIDVYFLPDRLTINTHLSNLVLWEKVDQLTEKNILIVTKKSNPKLVISQIMVKNIMPNQASIVTKVNSTTYVDNDMITIYFNTSGKKLLSADLSNVNLGKIEDKKPTTILTAVKAKNPSLLINEVTVDLNSINSRQATIIVKTESLKYIATSSVIVNYSLLNLQLGQIKDILFRKETGWGSSLFNFSVNNKIVQLDNGEILVPNENGILSQINLETKILNRRSSSFFSNSIIQMQDNIFWGQNTNKIYEYKQIGTDILREERTVFTDPNPDYDYRSTLTRLQDGTVLVTWGKNLYRLSSTGEKIDAIAGNYFNNSIQNVIQLANGKIWLQTERMIYEIDFFNKKLTKILDTKNTSFLSSMEISAIVPLQDGTVLLAGVPWEGGGNKKYDMYVLSIEGNIQTYHTDYNKPFIDDSIITSLIQLQDGRILALATGENWRIYQLNTE
ncbi:hypothetical protein [Spiroplasma sp. SV19]|uniref:hypothetical protein n=1 Tax=Spiroplasma sp. SV19 TaxID=2570468 RepID=UPI0024B66BD6|nr:hypothetical protein [Spiroplasma sp. SV19]WHQ36426.1 hypothetical protein E7Y35_00520 [Spiroplasma sp. SV19]